MVASWGRSRQTQKYRGTKRTNAESRVRSRRGLHANLEAFSGLRSVIPMYGTNRMHNGLVPDDVPDGRNQEGE